MAALRIFARRGLSQAVPASRATELSRDSARPIIVGIQKRWSNYRSSTVYDESAKYTDFEVSKDPKEWAYVERLLRCNVVPAPPQTDKLLPSGWKPPSDKVYEKPYFVRRTKNHMFPVYLDRTFRGMRRLTLVRYIEGDIWLLESELRTFIEKETGKRTASKINEFTGQIKFKGDFVLCVIDWLKLQGF